MIIVALRGGRRMLFHATGAKVAKVAKALLPDQNFCSNGMNPLGVETSYQLPTPSAFRLQPSAFSLSPFPTLPP
jgi:hypothetical protein